MNAVTWSRGARVGLAWVLTLALVATGVGWGSAPAQASGYHPPFDRAVAEAPWILHHTVISEHAPKDVLKDLPAQARGRVYLVKVIKVFRGPFKAGDKLYVWDPYYRSTAGYFLNAKGENLSFLGPPGSKRKYPVARRGKAKGAPVYRTHTTSGGKATAKNAALKLGVVFRNKSDTPSKGRGQGMKDWMTLLDLTAVGSRKIDLKQARTALVKTSGRELLTYVLTHWPGALSAPDAARVGKVIDARSDDAMVTASAVKLLRMNKVPLSATVLKRLLDKGAKHARQELIKDVSPKNIKAVRDVLWAWIHKDQAAALPAIRKLAKLEPAFLLAKLKATRLPFWLNIPALAALKKTPKDLGQKPYPVGALKASEYDLAELGNLVKGKTFGVWHAVSWNRSDRFAPLMSLLVPHFAKMKAKPQGVAVATLRTFGYTVKRTASTLVIGKRTKPPLVITLKPIPGQPRKIQLVETATVPVLLCPQQGSRQIKIRRKGGPETSTETSQGSFDGKQPKPCFQAKKGVVRTETVNLDSLIKQLKKPGTYQVTIALTHPYSGLEHGLDAWTGMVFSPPLALTLPLPAAATAKAKKPPEPSKTGAPPTPASAPAKSKKSGCRCNATAPPGHGLPLVLLLGLLLAARRRRRG